MVVGKVLEHSSKFTSSLQPSLNFRPVYHFLSQLLQERPISSTQSLTLCCLLSFYIFLEATVPKLLGARIILFSLLYAHIPPQLEHLAGCQWKAKDKLTGQLDKRLMTHWMNERLNDPWTLWISQSWWILPWCTGERFNLEPVVS